MAGFVAMGSASLEGFLLFLSGVSTYRDWTVRVVLFLFIFLLRVPGVLVLDRGPCALGLDCQSCLSIPLRVVGFPGRKFADSTFLGFRVLAIILLSVSLNRSSVDVLRINSNSGICHLI